MIKTLIPICLSALIVVNSMVFSIIQGSYELNKGFIVENFCVNKSELGLNCNGKCYLMKQLDAEKKRQAANDSYRFQADFGIFLQPVSLVLIPPIFRKLLELVLTGYLDTTTSAFLLEKFRPPQV